MTSVAQQLAALAEERQQQEAKLGIANDRYIQAEQRLSQAEAGGNERLIVTYAKLARTCTEQINDFQQALTTLDARERELRSTMLPRFSTSASVPASGTPSTVASSPKVASTDKQQQRRQSQHPTTEEQQQRDRRAIAAARRADEQERERRRDQEADDRLAAEALKRQKEEEEEEERLMAARDAEATMRKKQSDEAERRRWQAIEDEERKKDQEFAAQVERQRVEEEEQEQAKEAKELFDAVVSGIPALGGAAQRTSYLSYDYVLKCCREHFDALVEKGVKRDPKASIDKLAAEGERNAQVAANYWELHWKVGAKRDPNPGRSTAGVEKSFVSLVRGCREVNDPWEREMSLLSGFDKVVEPENRYWLAWSPFQWCIHLRSKRFPTAASLSHFLEPIFVSQIGDSVPIAALHNLEEVKHAVNILAVYVCPPVSSPPTALGSPMHVAHQALLRLARYCFGSWFQLSNDPPTSEEVMQGTVPKLVPWMHKHILGVRQQENARSSSGQLLSSKNGGRRESGFGGSSTGAAPTDIERKRWRDEITAVLGTDDGMEGGSATQRPRFEL